MGRHPLFRVAWIALVAGAAMVADNPVARAQSRLDSVEHIFGATNIHAVTGHGRLTAGIAADGTLTVLTWPNPSTTDQLAYITSNDLAARSMPRFGALPEAGIFLGLVVADVGGATEVTWLRDGATWQATQSYGPGDGANPVTVFVSDRLGLTVTLTDAIAPAPSDGSSGHDVLVRQVHVLRDATSTVAAASLLTYGNLSPTPENAHIPELPVADWIFDGRNDFAAVWDAAHDVVVHFHPSDQRVHDSLASVISPPAVDFGPIGQALQGTPTDAQVASLAAHLDDDYARGTYLALGTIPAPEQHQVGFDAGAWCDLDDTLADNLLALPDRFPGFTLPISSDVLNVLRCNRTAPPLRQAQHWTWDAEDALSDASDGVLSGSSIAAGEVNEALRTPLTFASAPDGTATADAGVLIGAGQTAAEAEAATLSVSNPKAVVQEADDALTAWLAAQRLPTGGSPAAVAVARRALINIRVGTADNGAIVASIARQAPYGLDWPRDGSFFNVLLDVAGDHDLVDRREDLYDQWQRKTPVRPTVFVDEAPPPNPDGTHSGTYPAGAWEMNYYPDGMPGGTWRFEIDEAAFGVWTLVAHAGWVESTNPASYLRLHWDAIELGANLLTRWRDPVTHLPAPAQEDDNPDYTQGLHGAVTTFGALDMASRAARLLGQDADAARWEHRAAELRDAILAHLYDPSAMRFVSGADMPVNPGSAPTGPTAWLVWPMRLLPWDDPRVDAQLRDDLDAIRPIVDLQTGGWRLLHEEHGVARRGAGRRPDNRSRSRFHARRHRGHGDERHRPLR